MKNFREYFDINWCNEKCGCNVMCTCTLTIRDKYRDYYREYKPLQDGIWLSREDRIRKMLRDISNDYVYNVFSGKVSPKKGIPLDDQLISRCAGGRDYALKHIPKPIDYVGKNNPTILPGISYFVLNRIFRADARYLHALSIVDRRLSRFVQPAQIYSLASTGYNTSFKEVLPLKVLALIPFLPGLKAIRRTAKGVRVVSCPGDLHANDHQKLVDTATGYGRNTRALPRHALQHMNQHLPKALELISEYCDSTKYFRTEIPNFNLMSYVEEMNLSSAGGVHGVPEVVQDNTGVKRKKNPNGKKWEVVPATIRMLCGFFSDVSKEDAGLILTWKQSFKEENLFPATYDDIPAKEKKARVFVIANLAIIILEHLVSIRRKLELGSSLGIGRTWAWGGADAILKHLHLFTEEEREQNVLNEGDLRNQDQTVRDFMLNIYFSYGEKYYVKGEHTQTIRDIITLLIQEFSQRVTHLASTVWALVMAGVPSGALNTSHMDSWILLLLFILFCLYQADRYPKLKKEILRHLIKRLLHIIIYGDDHLFTIPKHLQPYLGISVFSIYLKQMYGMEVKDMRSGHSPISIPDNFGELALKGAVYLKHYFVENPSKKKGQSKYVPYRLMDEIVRKVIFGRTSSYRDEVDVQLSVIGHAYGTYGSNEPLYLWLNAMFEECTLSSFDSTLIARRLQTKDSNIIRKFRQMDMHEAVIRKGFPTLDEIRARNEYIEDKHTFFQISNRGSQLFNLY